MVLLGSYYNIRGNNTSLVTFRVINILSTFDFCIIRDIVIRRTHVSESFSRLKKWKKWCLFRLICVGLRGRPFLFIDKFIYTGIWKCRAYRNIVCFRRKMLRKVTSQCNVIWTFIKSVQLLRNNIKRSSWSWSLTLWSVHRGAVLVSKNYKNLLQ